MAGESSMTPFYNDAPNPMFGPANPEALRQLYDKQTKAKKNYSSINMARPGQKAPSHLN